MKINSEINEVFTNTAESSGFNIEASAIAFKILSSQIYENKIRAIVREISCNAYDSHVMAGKPDEPFTVHLPNPFEPWFEVTDFGIGLSEDQIFNLYTTYFKSSKQDSNEVIGGLGLGSKSPFSYVDQFTVVSTYDGVRTTYSAFVGADGAPQITKVNSHKSVAENGVSVKIPVKPNDMRRFRDECESVFAWFSVVPNFEGTPLNVTKLKEDKPYYTVEGYNREEFYAVMGNVAYLTRVTDKTVLEMVRRVEGVLVVNFDIGDLSVSASRESLSLDKDTEKTIKDRLASIADNWNKDIQVEIDKCDGLYDIVSLTYSRHILANRGLFEFNGKKLKDYNKDFTEFNEKQMMRRIERKGWSSKTTRDIPFQIGGELDPLQRAYTILVLDDKKYLRHNMNELYQENMRGDHNCVLTCSPENLDIVKKMFEYCNVTYQKLSERIANGCRPERGSSSSARGAIVHFITSDNHDTSRLTLSEIKGKIKEMNKNTYIMAGDFRQSETINHIKVIAKTVKDGDLLVVVNESAAAKFIDDGVGKNYRTMTVSDDVEQQILDHIKNRNYDQLCRDYVIVTYFGAYSKDLKFIEEYIDDAEIMDLFKAYIGLSTHESKYGSLSYLDIKTICNSIDSLNQYKPKLVVDEKETAELREKILDFKDWFNRTFIIANLRNVANSDDDLLFEDYKLYIMTKLEKTQEKNDD